MAATMITPLAYLAYNFQHVVVAAIEEQKEKLSRQGITVSASNFQISWEVTESLNPLQLRPAPAAPAAPEEAATAAKKTSKASFASSSSSSEGPKVPCGAAVKTAKKDEADDLFRRCSKFSTGGTDFCLIHSHDTSRPHGLYSDLVRFLSADSAADSEDTPEETKKVIKAIQRHNNRKRKAEEAAPAAAAAPAHVAKKIKLEPVDVEVAGPVAVAPPQPQPQPLEQQQQEEDSAEAAEAATADVEENDVQDQDALVPDIPDTPKKNALIADYTSS